LGKREVRPILLSCRNVIQAFLGLLPPGDLKVIQFGCPAELWVGVRGMR
jgi:hypothetical protein